MANENCWLLDFQDGVISKWDKLAVLNKVKFIICRDIQFRFQFCDTVIPLLEGNFLTVNVQHDNIVVAMVFMILFDIVFSLHIDVLLVFGCIGGP